MWITMLIEILKQTWPFLLGIGIFILGYFYARSGEASRELEAKLDVADKINEAQVSIQKLESIKQKELDDVDKASRKDPASFANFANRLFSKVFKTKR